jgi:hypothetical protein
VKGQLRLTVIVKATFDMVPGAVMTLAAPDDLALVEAHHRNAPTQSVKVTSDVLPFVPAADALLTGHAYAPEGAPASALTVRFAVFREQALLEKLVHVYGDRVAGGGEIAPFEEMPLVYERAYGGLGSRDNPFGTGLGATDKAPNLIDPKDPRKPACFAPIAAAWPARKRLLDRPQQDGLKQPVVEIVGELDWQYFHAAPPDQRIAQYLKGNEWVVFDGMHPTLRSVQSRLPDARGEARVYGLGDPDGHAVAMVADTLRVDADRLSCSVTWRGHVTVPDEITLASLEVVGGVALGGRAVEWPARLEEDVLVEYESISGAEPSSDGPSEAKVAARPAYDGTVEAVPDAPRRRPLPFVAGQAALPPPQPKPLGASTGTLDGTMAILVDGPTPPRPLPFDRGAPSAPPFTVGDPQRVPQAPPIKVREAPKPRAQPDWSGTTLTITKEEDETAGARAPLPFADPGRPPVVEAEIPKPPAVDDATPPPAHPSPFAMGLSPAPLAVEPSVAAPTFLKRAPRTLQGVAPARPVAPAAPRRKAARTAMGIDLFPSGPLAIEVVPWGLTPARDVLTVIAKATCDLSAEGPAVPRAAADPPTGEAQAGPPPRCVYPSDLVPYKVRADVVLVGHAFAKDGSATSMDVVFRFGSEGNGFERRVTVFGDRRWEKSKFGLEPSAPEPFARMAIAFDRAFGGPRFALNPAGIGHHDPMHRGPVLLPNLEDPEQVLRNPRQMPAPAVFAPIPIAWKDRWAIARVSGLCLAEEAIDWARFQAAPASQQLAFLRGDEPFTLVGLSARHPTLAGALPGLRARAFATRKQAGGEAPGLDEIALRLDTVVFDVDAMKLDLVWRGALPVADEQKPDVAGIYLLADKLGAETELADVRAKVLRP